METTPIKPTAADETTPSAEQSSNRSSAAKSMSASLREKLKRSRHSFKSPLSVVKRLKIEDDTEPQPLQQGEEEKHGVKDDRDSNVTETDVNRNDMKLQRDSNHTAELPSQQCEALRKAVKERTETLRRLKMVKMYRKKNDLNELQRLTDKWRSCAQSVLYELQRELATGGKQASLSQLIDSFGIDDKLLHFDRTEEDFTDT